MLFEGISQGKTSNRIMAAVPPLAPDTKEPAAYTLTVEPAG